MLHKNHHKKTTTTQQMSSSSSTLLQNCKLTYFGIPGRGEATRLALTIGGVTFQDERVAFPDWGKLKPTTPWGSLPILSLKDGRSVAQQRAILRLVGKETGLYPQDDAFVAAKIDELMDAVEDIGQKTNSVGQGLEKEAKEKARAEACAEGGVTYAILQNVDNFIAANNGGKGGGYTVGSTLSIADLYLYTSCNNLVSGLYDGVPTTTTLEPFANINAVRKTVRNHPAVTQYYIDHPTTIESYGPL